MSQNQIRFICIAVVCQLVGMSKTSIYTINDFPRPVKIKGAGAPRQGGARWVESEVISWMQSRIQQRDTNTSK